MKKIIIALILLLAASTVDAQSFIGRTKNKPVTRLTKSQVKKIQKGENLYKMKKGKIKKNL